MQIETCKKILDQAKQIGIRHITFNGYGENILHKNFIEALKYAVNMFDIVDFNTNGLALSDSLCDEILKIKLDSISFSVTGFNADIYNNFQGTNFNNNIIRDKVYNNILNFIEKRNDKRNNVKIYMQCILTDKSREDILDYIEFWEDKINDINITYLNSIFDENTTFNKKAFALSIRKCRNIGQEILIYANWRCFDMLWGLF